MHVPALTRGARFTLAALVLAAVAAAVAVVQLPSLRSALHDSLVRRPAAVTELYFDPREPLPAEVKAGTSPVLHYVVANHAGTSRTYTVTIASDGRPPVAQSLTVPAGDVVTEQVVLQPGTAGSRCTLVVALSATQRITFAADVVA